MKKIFISAVCLFFSFCALSSYAADLSAANDVNYTTIKASNEKIAFIGRTLISENGAVSFDWSGVTCRIKFEGNFLSMKVSDTKKNYYNVWIDRAPDQNADKIIATFGSDSTIVLFEGGNKRKDKKAIHSVIIQKRTEGEQGTTTISEFNIGGKLLNAEQLKPRCIEFIGDSYTCGYGAEGKSGKERFRPETENVNLAYENIICRFFDADCYIVAHSGMGVARNYADKFKNCYMPHRYHRTFDMVSESEQKWNAQNHDFKPAAVVIMLGTNDFSAGRQPRLSLFKANYESLIKSIKENYGENIPVLCISAAKNDPMVYEYIKRVCQDTAFKNVHCLNFGRSIFPNKEFGSDCHPNYQAHKRLARAAIPYISTLTDWPIDDNKLIY